MHKGTNLSELLDRVVEETQTKKDLIVPGSAIRFVDSSGTAQAMIEGARFAVRDHAHRQIGAATGIPREYYEKMSSEAPDLLVENINRWLPHLTPRMVRTVAPSGVPTMRAFLSEKYRPLDNFDLMEHVLPVLSAAGVEIRSAELTDKRLYIQASHPRVTADVGVGDIVRAGVIIGNSETGEGSLYVMPLMERLACLNGMVMNVGAQRRAHIGGNRGRLVAEDGSWVRDETLAMEDRALFMRVADSICGALDEAVFTQRVGAFREVAGDRLGDDVQKVVDVTGRKLGLSEGERVMALRNLIDGGLLTRWGLANAVTAIANEDAKSYDRAVELERIGGDIMALPVSALK